MARRTLSRLAVLGALLESPTKPRYGLDISRAAGLATGTVYPILARLEADGWVESYWEDIDAAAEGRPRRRYYRLVGTAVPAAKAEVRSAERAVGLAWRPGVAGGQV